MEFQFPILTAIHELCFAGSWAEDTPLSITKLSVTSPSTAPCKSMIPFAASTMIYNNCKPIVPSHCLYTHVENLQNP